MRAPGAAAALAALLAAACGDGIDLGVPAPPRLAAPVRVSGESPFAPGCNRAGQAGRRYAGSEVEPHVAVHPVNPDHLVAAWQQERWSNGGADGIVAGMSLDGGRSWTTTPVPFSRCGGGTSAAGGDYERASDPWVSFSSDGTVVHLVGLAFDVPPRRDAILASRSTDGGLTWSAPRAIAVEEDPDAALDKPSLTADPAWAGAVYAVWDRLTGLASASPADDRGPAWFSRSLDGGETWEAPRAIYDPGPDAQTIANQIAVLPGGALVDVLVRIADASEPTSRVDVLALRSDDAGESWSAAALVARVEYAPAVDPKSGHGVRAAALVPSVAVDPAAGTLHVAWQDGRFGGAGVGIAVASSADGGATWTPPSRVNAEPSAQAFLPAIAAGEGGVAVTYYDLRHDVPSDPDHLWATVWRATSEDGGASWLEIPEGGPFDLRRAPDAAGFFVGDYTGLVARGDGFTALFAMSGADPADVFASAEPLASASAVRPTAPVTRGRLTPHARARTGAIRIRR